ncbi:MAG: Phospho-N-acetylmuramoyl-pentapeptide-transferase [Parcubacteria group bacterium Athens0416_74]|nr:MAG: Phospho-N-acetylmuramoyl-pentapeptide-transferase [Parcubacteria group bacterium Athens0416_74]
MVMEGILSDIVRVLVPAAAAFILGMALTPVLTHYLYKYKAWKKTPGKIAYDGKAAEEFNRLHVDNEVRAPRMGGIVVWGSVLLTILSLSFLTNTFDSILSLQLDFLSRNQTWIPLAALMVGALAGLFDDLLVIQPGAEGMPLRLRLLIVLIMSTFIGWWFWDKLDVVAVNIPFGAPLEIGFLIVPFFVLVSLALYASGVIDGIDGLSGGVFASIFASYTIIAFVQEQIDLAAFSAAIVGGLLAFLWFNIPPARFYMSDTGTMGLTLAIGTIAFMTDNLGGGVGIAVLPIIGFLLVATVASDILQLIWKKVLGRKLFRIAPLHHHFEAIGWPGPKVVMRYWVLSVVFAFAGVILAIAAISS